MSGKRYQDDEEKAVYYDPYSQQKITGKWTPFMERMMKDHPRMGHALSSAIVNGHTLKVTVGTEIIRDELMRNQGEITLLLQECCGIEGSVILEVTVSATQDDNLPHRTIDKVRFLVEQNPELNTLIQDLTLDTEA